MKDRPAPSITLTNLLSRKWQHCPVLAPRYSLPKKSKNLHSNLALEMEGLSPGGTTSLLLLKHRHSTLYYTLITSQWSSLKIYCLFYTLVWEVLIRTEFKKRHNFVYQTLVVSKICYVLHIDVRTFIDSSWKIIFFEKPVFVLAWKLH